MGFWEAATDQAGRRFGDRFWGWFVAARVLRRLAPFLAVVTIGAGVVLAYRWLSPDWAAVGGTAAGWLPAVGGVLLWVVLALVVIAVGVAAALWLKANWWRMHFERPMWMRRY